MGLFSIFGKKKNEEELIRQTVCSPVKGEVIPLEDVEDEGFASGAIGPGVGIIPREGMVYAPVSGEVCALFPTGHAVGIRCEDGAEVLLHIGIDTVSMNGDGFAVKIRQGDHVSVGDLLVEVDLPKVRAAGHKDTILLLVTNAEELGGLSGIQTGSTEVQRPVFSYTPRRG